MTKVPETEFSRVS